MRIFGKTPEKIALQNLKDKDLLLLILYFLGKQNFERLDESRLHKAAYFFQSELHLRYRFFLRPLTFSYDLLKDIEEAKSEGYIAITIEVIDESVPRYSYELTSIGRAKAENILNSLALEDIEKMERFSREAVATVTK